jgi:hypothetical protein
MVKDKNKSWIVGASFNHLEELFDSKEGQEANLIWLEIGSRRHLGAGDITRAAQAIHDTAKRLKPHQTLALTIGGYEYDPRELADIPEVTKFLRRTMQQAGISHWSHPLVKALNEVTLALLIDSGVFGNDHPYVVQRSKEDTTDIFTRYRRKT